MRVAEGEVHVLVDPLGEGRRLAQRHSRTAARLTTTSQNDKSRDTGDDTGS